MALVASLKSRIGPCLLQALLCLLQKYVRLAPNSPWHVHKLRTLSDCLKSRACACYLQDCHAVFATNADFRQLTLLIDCMCKRWNSTLTKCNRTAHMLAHQLRKIQDAQHVVHLREQLDGHGPAQSGKLVLRQDPCTSLRISYAEHTGSKTITCPISIRSSTKAVSMQSSQRPTKAKYEPSSGPGKETKTIVQPCWSVHVVHL